MRLEPVTGRPFICACVRCDKRVEAGDYSADLTGRVYADLDGKAFVDYYCVDCAEIVRSGR